MVKLEEIRRKKGAADRERHTVKGELNQLEANESAYMKLDKQKNAISSKLGDIQNRIGQSEFGQQQAELERIETELKSISENLGIFYFLTQISTNQGRSFFIQFQLL